MDSLVPPSPKHTLTPQMTTRIHPTHSLGYTDIPITLAKVLLSISIINRFAWGNSNHDPVRSNTNTP